MLPGSHAGLPSHTRKKMCSGIQWGNAPRENIMRKYVLSGLLLVGLCSMGFDWLKERVTSTANAPRYMENLGRGVVAVRSSETEVSLSWRLLGFEPQDL